MSEEREPVRLRDDPAQDRALRDMLEAARGESANDAMLDRVLAGVLASAGGGGGGSGGGGAAAKIAAGVGAVAIGAGVIALVISSWSWSWSSSPRASVDAVDAAVVVDAWAEPDADVVDVGVDAYVRIAHVTPRPPPPPPSSVVPVETDGALLMRATREHEPSASLALALEHRARFPSSPSSEDREALIILDLARLGRASDARAAADAFFARWPRSADRSRIESALARMH